MCSSLGLLEHVGSHKILHVQILWGKNGIWGALLVFKLKKKKEEKFLDSVHTIVIFIFVSWTMDIRLAYAHTKLDSSIGLEFDASTSIKKHTWKHT